MRATLLALMIATGFGLSVTDGRLIAAAPPRFRVLTTDPLDGVRGLQVYTVRDEQSGQCYAVFVLATAEGEPFVPDVGVLSPGERSEKVQLARRLTSLLATRDQQIADLRARARDVMWTVQYEAAREQIEQDYERAVRELLPGLYPAAQVAPGWRTTSTEELDNAVRVAIAEGQAEEAAQARAAANNEVLRRLGTPRQPGVAVTGPIACTGVKR